MRVESCNLPQKPWQIQMISQTQNNVQKQYFREIQRVSPVMGTPQIGSPLAKFIFLHYRFGKPPLMAPLL